MFDHLKIRTRILGIPAVLAAGYLLLLATMQFSATATHQRMSRISSNLFPAALEMQEAGSSFERMQKHYGDAVVLQDAGALGSAEKDAEATDAALQKAKTALASTADLGPQAGALFASWTSIRSRERDTYSAILAAANGPSDELMGQMAALGKENKALSQAFGSLDAAVAADFQIELNTVDGYSVRNRRIGLLMLGFEALVCAMAWWVVQFKVVLPLRQLSLGLQDIAEGEGNLTRRIQVDGRNEIDEVGRWFNVFIARIEDIVKRVSTSAQTLRTAATGLAQAANETAIHAAREHEQADSITATMNEMCSAVHQIGDKTQTAVTNAREAEKNARVGGNTVQSTVQTIVRLQETNRDTSERIEQLGRSSEAIGTIIKVINEIAGQINLLALNASIEAARAGEHGRGFAVVAGEVRRLAERTSVATKEIDQTVKSIQTGTTEAVASMRSSMAEVQVGVDAARSAGVVITNIVEGSESVRKTVSQIAEALTEQSRSAGSVRHTVNEIAAVVERTAASAKQSVGACEKLAQLANELTGLTGSFKVG